MIKIERLSKEKWTVNLNNRYNNDSFSFGGDDEIMGTGMILPWQGFKSTEKAHSKQQATQLKVKLIFNDENDMVMWELTLKGRQDVFMELTS